MVEKNKEVHIVTVGFDPVAKEVVIKHGSNLPEIGIPAIGLIAKQYGPLGVVVVELKIGGVEVSFVSAAEETPNKLVVVPGDPNKVTISLTPISAAIHLIEQDVQELRKEEDSAPSKENEIP